MPIAQELPTKSERTYSKKSYFVLSYNLFGRGYGKIHSRDYEFDVPTKLVDLYKTKNYGSYAENGKIPVCFIAKNHTMEAILEVPQLTPMGI
jgi:hypothetical protein